MDSRRNIEDIIEKMIAILHSFCKDPILKSQWINDIQLIEKYDKLYWNLAPEILIPMKLMKLTDIVNHYIPEGACIKSWEQQIIDILIDNEEVEEEHHLVPDYKYF
jgi:hypothetical protein